MFMPLRFTIYGEYVADSRFLDNYPGTRHWLSVARQSSRVLASAAYPRPTSG